ncbi:APC membrane recruitment protein 2-like [Osmerus mordax]|uniref:APC membrane recruitment protein 2-like n=1 Tax=Osmerus mordax TaxID=8014 RepID=UPI00350EBE5E
MDQHSESGESPPCDPQPAGKTRKGFKLFGKRKPGSGVGSIFSMRSKGDGNNPNKSSIARSNTQDGLGETVAQEFEQEPEKRQEQDIEVGQRDEAEIAGEVDEISGYDGTSYSVPPRPSISSVTSAKSLGFLSLLRGGRHGGRDRHAHTVSQPSMKQRRGLKGLFGSVPWHQREKEPKEQTPPSPLLMTSRTNSVEIIKEDLTLTPKTPLRTMTSPDQEPDTAAFATTPERSDAGGAVASENTCGSNLDVLEAHPPPVPTTEPPLYPVVDRLSSLMADISLLISFDSFTGCGDIIADVEAEWGKASSAAGGASTTLTPITKSFMSSVPSTKLTPHSISPPTKFVISSSTFNQPSPILSTNIKPNLTSTPNLTPNSTPTPHPVSTSSSITSSFTCPFSSQSSFNILNHRFLFTPDSIFPHNYSSHSLSIQATS